MSSCEMDAPFDEGAITLCVDDFSEASLPLVGAGPEAAFNTAAGDIVDGTAVSRGLEELRGRCLQERSCLLLVLLIKAVIPVLPPSRHSKDARPTTSRISSLFVGGVDSSMSPEDALFRLARNIRGT